jgi:hypothetical protein
MSRLAPAGLRELWGGDRKLLLIAASMENVRLSATYIRTA